MSNPRGLLRIAERNPTELVYFYRVQIIMMQGQRNILYSHKHAAFLLMGACLAPSFSPDGAAGEHEFAALKPVVIHDGKGVCVCVCACVMYNMCLSGSIWGIWMCAFSLKMTGGEMEIHTHTHRISAVYSWGIGWVYITSCIPGNIKTEVASMKVLTRCLK